MTSSIIKKSLLVDASGNSYTINSGVSDICLGVVGLQNLSLGEISKPSLTTQGALYHEPTITFELRKLLNGETIFINAMSAPQDNGPIIAGNTDIGQIIPYGTGITVSFEISGNNANDVSAGTGARAVTIEGLDGNYNPISEVVLTNGTTATVPLANAYNHINNFYVSDAGSGGNVADTIVLRDVSSSSVWGLAGANIQGTGFFKCPAGKKAVLSKILYSSGTASTQWRIVVWRKDVPYLTTVARYDNNIPYINYPTVVLEEGDSCYLFQQNVAGCKVLLGWDIY